MKYKYKDPREMGFKKVKISKKDHNKLFPKNKVGFFQRYEYFLHEEIGQIITHKYTSYKIFIWIIPVTPFAIFWHGFKEYISEVKDIINEKEKGHFVATSIYKNRGPNTYDNFLKMVK